ncbi:hypothetical protein [Embleya sp. NBC_00896]|uniref:hypothetical protein n=1 Tax=Embleya sp. NBC_00896 TaxID=2975961 RepID=UPI002F916114|nr:hypothetical protein OG928_41495 [Embleya sp. NBC_00896]
MPHFGMPRNAAERRRRRRATIVVVVTALIVAVVAVLLLGWDDDGGSPSHAAATSAGPSAAESGPGTNAPSPAESRTAPGTRTPSAAPAPSAAPTPTFVPTRSPAAPAEVEGTWVDRRRTVLRVESAQGRVTFRDAPTCGRPEAVAGEPCVDPTTFEGGRPTVLRLELSVLDGAVVARVGESDNPAIPVGTMFSLSVVGEHVRFVIPRVRPPALVFDLCRVAPDAGPNVGCGK